MPSLKRLFLRSFGGSPPLYLFRYSLLDPSLQWSLVPPQLHPYRLRVLKHVIYIPKEVWIPQHRTYIVTEIVSLEASE